MSRKKKFHQISKEDENSNNTSSMQPLPTLNKGTKRMKKWEWEDDPKTIYESSRRKDITISKSKIQRIHKHIFSKKDSQSDEEIINSSIKIEEEKMHKASIMKSY